jgi:hypothetical protein
VSNIGKSFYIIEFRKYENHINRLVLKIIFIKIYIYSFSVNIFIKKEVKRVFWRPCRCPKRFLLPNQREYVKILQAKKKHPSSRL